MSLCCADYIQRRRKNILRELLDLKMGKKKCLTPEEQGKIKILHEEGYSNRAIARRTGRSHQVVSKFLAEPENYGKRFKGRKKFVTTERERRAIIREASNSTLTASQIAHNVGTKASLRTVQKILQQCPHLKRLKIKRKPALKPFHISERLRFAREKMHWKTEWFKVIFSDEKKFNRDGPDGFSFYFHDLRKNELILSRRRTDVGSVMVWGAISYKGVIDLVFLKGRQNSQKYIELLEKERGTFIKVNGGSDFIFQHDNASIHSAYAVRSWFKNHNINILEWPSNSPDLNIMENVWGWLSLQVYKNSRQFSTSEELQKALQQAWNQIPVNYLKTLYDSMPSRIFELIQKNGKCTNY